MVTWCNRTVQITQQWGAKVRWLHGVIELYRSHSSGELRYVVTYFNRESSRAGNNLYNSHNSKEETSLDQTNCYIAYTLWKTENKISTALKGDNSVNHSAYFCEACTVVAN